MKDSPKNLPHPPTTKEITNFSGKLTRVQNGPMDSGFAKFATSHSIDSFTQPRNLKFMEQPVNIGSVAGSVIGGLVVAAQYDVGNQLVYAVTDAAKLYSIQPVSTTNPNYDRSSLLCTMTGSIVGALKGGSSMSLNGGTVLIGHDNGVTSINKDGSNEKFIGVPNSWNGGGGNINHRPTVFFGSSQYYANVNNLAAVTPNGSSSNVTSYGVLSPAFPNILPIADLAVSTDGTRLVTLLSGTNRATDVNATNYDSLQPTTGTGEGSSISYWNLIDAGPTAFTFLGNFTPTKYFTMNGEEYCWGQGANGMEIRKPMTTIATFPGVNSPWMNASNANSNMVQFTTAESADGKLQVAHFMYGQYDEDFGTALYRPLRMASSIATADVLRVPVMLPVSTFQKTGLSAPMTNDIASYSKIYYSTMERSSVVGNSSTTTALYSFNLFPQGTGSAMAGVYETQTEYFKEKIKATEYRIYSEPVTSTTSFKIDLVGGDNKVINGGTKTFDASATSTVGNDYAYFSPAMTPALAMGVRITNVGSTTPVIKKIEIDIEPYGN